MISSNVRIPEELLKELKKQAKKEERSIYSQLIFIIKKYLEDVKIKK